MDYAPGGNVNANDVGFLIPAVLSGIVAVGNNTQCQADRERTDEVYDAEPESTIKAYESTEDSSVRVVIVVVEHVSPGARHIPAMRRTSCVARGEVEERRGGRGSTDVYRPPGTYGNANGNGKKNKQKRRKKKKRREPIRIHFLPISWSPACLFLSWSHIATRKNLFVPSRSSTPYGHPHHPRHPLPHDCAIGTSFDPSCSSGMPRLLLISSAAAAHLLLVNLECVSVGHLQL